MSPRTPDVSVDVPVANSSWKVHKIWNDLWSAKETKTGRPYTLCIIRHPKEYIYKVVVAGTHESDIINIREAQNSFEIIEGLNKSPNEVQQFINKWTH